MSHTLRLLAMLLLLPAAAAAQTFPAPLSDYISDYAEVIDPETEARITDTLRATRAETGVHIAVATIASRAEYGDSARIEDFAQAWFNAWGIGDKDRNDGILILIAVDDQEMRIALGSGFPVIYDGRAQRVIDTAMLPAFREDRFAAGIEAGAISATERLARPFAAQEAVTETSGFPAAPVNDGLPLWMIIIGLAGAALAVFRARISDAAVRLRRCPGCGHFGLSRRRISAPKPAKAENNGGIISTRCSKCDYRDERGYSIPGRSRDRSGADRSGGDGSGGGRSSGGGATGRW